MKFFVLNTKENYDIAKNTLFIDLYLLTNLKNRVFVAKSGNKFFSLWEIIPLDVKEIEFIIDSNSEIVWQETNKLVANCLFDLLKKEGKALTKLEVNINENGFSLDFIALENFSKSELQAIEINLLKNLKLFFNLEISLLKGEQVKIIKLIEVSGIQIDDHSKIGNRIIGIATIDKESFSKYKKKVEDAQLNDHRKLGKELEIFFIDETYGKGFPIWLQNGVIIKELIQKYILSLEEKYSYFRVETPVVASIELYKISGHYFHYKKNMFPEMINQESEHLMLRPMACPHHILVYKYKPRSYRDLPVRISESVKQYRYEASGSLMGLQRVRSMELTDGHIFLEISQLKQEIESIFNLIVESLEKFGINIHYIELALHDAKDKTKYHDDEQKWTLAESILEEFLVSKKVSFKILRGEAAFYGPKIDIQIKNNLGHIITMSTIQLDFVLPEKFELSYIDANNKKQIPIMIHRGIIGTYERFISILLEQKKGVLPFWLSPLQVVIIPISENQFSFAKEVKNYLSSKNIRTKIDDSKERLGNKIRSHQINKTPYQIILGEVEVLNKKISYRKYNSKILTNLMHLEEFVNNLQKEIDSND